MERTHLHIGQVIRPNHTVRLRFLILYPVNSISLSIHILSMLSVCTTDINAEEIILYCICVLKADTSVEDQPTGWQLRRLSRPASCLLRSPKKGSPVLRSYDFHSFVGICAFSERALYSKYLYVDANY